jgi:uncharacterized protein
VHSPPSPARGRPGDRSLTAAEIAGLGGAAFLAGAVNAVAGGGSLISFPALLWAGYPALTANVTNTVALLPGYLGGTIGYRRELAGQRARALRLGAISVAGAALGAALLLVSSERLFREIVPWLILFSCALLAAQPWLAARLSRRATERAEERAPGLVAGQVVSGAYGAYFGAGLGVMMLAVLAIFLRDDLQRLNALKGLLSLVINAVAVAAFAVFGPVAWGPVAVMAALSLLGGQAGVLVARRLPAPALRAAVVAFGIVVAVVLLIE